MASEENAQSLLALRVITQRLTSTPTWQLPHIVPYLASMISEHGKHFLVAGKPDTSIDWPDFAVPTHQLKTQISTLLQDRSAQGRWAAIVLIKATVAVGGWEFLQGIGGWVRGLLGILGKRDPQATKKICIITLTSIFIRTHEHQSLIREITTPSLPGFVTSCISILKIDAHGPLAEVVLQALAELTPGHPASFRPFIGQIRSLISPLVASTPSSVPKRSRDDDFHEQHRTASEQIAQSSRRLLVVLNICAPKNTAGEEWAKSLHSVIEAAHRTADLVFRAVLEDWESPTTRSGTTSDPAAVVSDDGNSPLDLPSWRGIYAGVERLDGLLQTLYAFVANPTSMAVTLPLGALLDVANRMLSMLPPSKGKNPRTNPEISKEEREGLWVGLPRIHASAMLLVLLLISRLGNAFAPASNAVLEEILWVLQHEPSNSDIRESTYEVTSQILALTGPSLSKTSSKPLSTCIKLCCDDSLPSPEPKITEKPASTAPGAKPFQNGSSTINADSYLKPTSNHPSTSKPPTDLQIAAAALLPLFITHLPPNFLSFSLRTQIDRTAILAQNREAMLASVLNPPVKRKGRKDASSIMPVLARSYPECMEVEALIRPRMPVLQFRRRDEGEDDSDEDEDIEMEIPDTYAATTNKNNNFPLPNHPTPSTSAQPSFTTSPVPAPTPHPPPQNPSQPSQPTTIPETQSFTTNPKKRDLDSASASESQPSSKPSTTNTGFELALAHSFASPTEAISSAKRPRLDDALTISGIPAVHALNTSTAVPETQAQPALATANIPAVVTTQPSAPQPTPLVGKQGVGEEGESSGDDEDFEIPAIDPTMDTDEEEDDEDDDDE